MSDNRQPASSPKPGLWQSLGSVGAAFFGVQSDSKRRRDDAQGDKMMCLAVFKIATVVFIVSVWAMVTLVMSLVAK